MPLAALLGSGDLLRSLGIRSIGYQCNGRDWRGDLRDLLRLPLLSTLESRNLYGLWWLPGPADPLPACDSLEDLKVEVVQLAELGRLGHFRRLRRLELGLLGPSLPLLDGLGALPASVCELVLTGHVDLEALEALEGLGAAVGSKASVAGLMRPLRRLRGLRRLALRGFGLSREDRCVEGISIRAIQAGAAVEEPCHAAGRRS